MVVLADGVDVLLEFARLFELLVIALSLDVRVCSQHDILVVAVDVFLPHGEPSTLLIVLDLLPLVPIWWLGHHGVFADVDGDLLGCDTLLEASSLGVLATSTEETWRFDTEVANLLFATVPHAVKIRRLELVLGSFQCLLLSGW